MAQLSVITTTRNSVNNLPRLIESLQNQSVKSFEWVVQDCCSTDGTVELIRSSNLPVVSLKSEEDAGIVDALNKAIKRSSGEFYVFVGDDDYLYPTAIERYVAAISERPQYEIHTAPITYNGRLLERSRRPEIYAMHLRYITGHAVGTCIKRDLHDRIGYYEVRYWSCPDAFFVLSAVRADIGINVLGGESMGCYGTSGESARNVISTFCGLFRMQIEDFGYPLYSAVIVLNLKIFIFKIRKLLERLKW